MSHRMSRRAFAALGTGTALATTACPAKLVGAPASSAEGMAARDVRPYQLMCVVCRLGAGCGEDLGDSQLTALRKAVREDPKLPLRLRCQTDHVYRYQNPGPAADTPEGPLFNAKRDLDVLQKLGLAPGDTRPAIDLFERLLTSVPHSRGICGYAQPTGAAWQGCRQAASGDYEKGVALGIKALIPPRDPQQKAHSKKASSATLYAAEKLQIRPHHLLCMSCFYGRMKKLAPIVEDNLFEAIDRIQKSPETPVTLIAGVCMICPPCSKYDAGNKLCLGGRSMALRDQKKDLDVLQKLGLKYGDTLPARALFRLVYERIASTKEICGYGDNIERAREWSICDGARNDAGYQKAKAEGLGLRA